MTRLRICLKNVLVEFQARKPPGWYGFASIIPKVFSLKSGEARMMGLLVGSPISWVWYRSMMESETRYVLWFQISLTACASYELRGYGPGREVDCRGRDNTPLALAGIASLAG
jgi:hypothetical protein